MNKKFVNKKDAKELITKLGDEFAVVKNPGYIHPEYELYPLAPKIKKPVSGLVAVVMDMDGTTTTTEALCIHSLEFMVRKFSGRMEKSNWNGLDETKDYPNIIGNSTTKHVEYLIDKYQNSFEQNEVIKSFLFSAAWTISCGNDQNRKAEVILNIIQSGCVELLIDKKLNQFKTPSSLSDADKENIANYLFEKYRKGFYKLELSNLVKLGIDVYYQHYHEILERIKLGEGKLIAEELFDNSDKHLIEAMPGIEVFLALIKGLIDRDEDIYFEQLLKDYKIKSGNMFDQKKIDKARRAFFKLCKEFTKHPIKVAIVTSSIFYEADIVLREVFKVIISELDNFIPESDKKRTLLDKFKTYQAYYDAVVTASDSSEIRLKPHRDLYSIALHKVGISKNKFSQVVGFEDSESGTIAIRAAGIGLSIAVPFAETSGHNLKAATYICKGGLPEVILQHNLFLNLK